MRRSEKTKRARLAFEWCRNNLKKSRFKVNFPRFIIRSEDDKFKGYYEGTKNIICIYIDNNHNSLDISETVIHEWKHYQQDIEGMYHKYIDKYGRNNNNHPYEITARNFSIKYAELCNKWIGQKIK